MNRVIKWCFFAFIVRPLLLVLVGVNLRHRERLPAGGPAILVANHNSHLDALLLMALFPLSQLPAIRPVGARDYFYGSAWMRAFSRNCLGLIPLDRTPKREAVAGLLEPCLEALDRGEILIVFPEGTRGEAERMGPLKGGVARLASQRPEVPVIPLFLRGTGKCLPRGEALLVPLICDAVCGLPVESPDADAGKKGFGKSLERSFQELEHELPPLNWE